MSLIAAFVGDHQRDADEDALARDLVAGLPDGVLPPVLRRHHLARVIVRDRGGARRERSVSSENTSAPAR